MRRSPGTASIQISCQGPGRGSAHCHAAVRRPKAHHTRRVAVGTRISPRPPHRSRRALLTHRAPPSGSGVEAVTRQRVYSSDWRKEAGDELDEPLPAEACRLAAPLERCEPEPLPLVEQPPQARVVILRIMKAPKSHIPLSRPG